jgi:acetylornithine/N-succinyldiaminopimelate aminotransferase
VISQLLAPGFLDEVRAKGEYLKELLLDLSKELVLDGERGEGLLRALKLNRDIGPEIVERARNLEPIGLLLNSPRPNLIRFMPALNISREELKQMVDLLRGVIKSIK